MSPEKKAYSNDLLTQFEDIKQVISSVRTIRKEKNIPMKQSLDMYTKGNFDFVKAFSPVLSKLCNLDNIKQTTDEIENAITFLVKTTEFYIPVGNVIDKDEEIKKLEEELKYNQGFQISVTKKLANESFVNNAPAKVVEMERKKLADAELKIKALIQQIESLK